VLLAEEGWFTNCRPPYASCATLKPHQSVSPGRPKLKMTCPTALQFGTYAQDRVAPKAATSFLAFDSFTDAADHGRLNSDNFVPT
jgi:hypothetical protein